MAGVYSFNGIKAAVCHEAAFRQELVLAVIALPVAFLAGVSSIERVALVSVTILVLVVELLNSGLESVVDRIGTEHHELSGRAKDMGSAAVLLSIALWLYVWVDLLVLGVWLRS